MKFLPEIEGKKNCPVYSEVIFFFFLNFKGWSSTVNVNAESSAARRNRENFIRHSPAQHFATERVHTTSSCIIQSFAARTRARFQQTSAWIPARAAAGRPSTFRALLRPTRRSNGDFSEHWRLRVQAAGPEEAAITTRAAAERPSHASRRSLLPEIVRRYDKGALDSRRRRLGEIGPVRILQGEKCSAQAQRGGHWSGHAWKIAQSESDQAGKIAQPLAEEEALLQEQKPESRSSQVEIAVAIAIAAQTPEFQWQEIAETCEELETVAIAI